MKKNFPLELGLANKLAATSSAFAIAVSMAFAPGAFAQDDVDLIEENQDEIDDSEDTIVVTGSRIRQNEFTSQSPVQVIDPSIAELQGTFDTASLVQSSSVAAGSSQITAAISSNFVTEGGTGTQTVSLRGLGANRTLVLLNGRRAGPAGTRGEVNAFDLNVIPQSVISTVEILKDGASSIYGSDAVAGVVNLITKSDFDGLEVDAFYSQPFESGGERFRGSATYGKNFDRGHFQLAFDYYKEWEVKRRDREYLDCAEDYIFDPVTGQRSDFIDPRGPGVDGFNYTGPDGFHCASQNGSSWGHIWLYDYSYIYGIDGGNVTGGPSPIVDSNGDPALGTILFQYDYSGALAANGVPNIIPPRNANEIGLPANFFPVRTNALNTSLSNDYNIIQRDDSIIPETERFTIYGDAAFELTDSIEAYIEFLGNRRTTEVVASRQFWNFGGTSNAPGLGGFGIPSDPVVNPAITGDALISPTAYTDHFDSKVEITYWRTLGGLRGDFQTGGFLDGWQWDLYGQYSRNKGEYTNEQILDDANSGIGDFRSASCVGTVTPISGRNCIDVDYNDPQFLAGFQTPEQRAFLFDTETGETIYTQTYVEGFVTGDFFSLPAGTVSAALGATWRRDEIEDTPGPITLADNAWQVSGAGITAGSSNTKEVFGEVQIPVLRDAPLIQAFDVAGSVRYTDVSTAGSDVTWKASANWRVNDWVRFRGTYGTSFRAPALFELFLADQTSSLSQRLVDPCINWGAQLAQGAISQQLADNCAAQGVPDDHTGSGVSATIITGGGIGVLTPETSKAWTASIILSPTFLIPENASLEIAVDYFDIEVNGEIASLGAGNVVAGCLTSDFFPTDPLCSLFDRGQTGAPSNINEVRDSFVNVNSQENRGIDITMRYVHEDLLDGWDLDVLSQWTHQLQDDIALFEGTTVSVNGEDGEPRWVGDVNFILEKNDWRVFWGMDIVGPTSDEQDFIDANETLCPTDVVRLQFCVDLTAEARVYHNISATKEFRNFRITAGIANLFDTAPPRVSTEAANRGEIRTIGQVPIEASVYDLIGRRAFFNVTASF